MKRISYTILQNPESEEESVFAEKIVECANNQLAECEEIAKSEAYNGEYTVEDIPDEPAEPTQLDRIEAQTMFTALMTDTLLEEDIEDV